MCSWVSLSRYKKQLVDGCVLKTGSCDHLLSRGTRRGIVKTSISNAFLELVLVGVEWKHL